MNDIKDRIEGILVILFSLIVGLILVLGIVSVFDFSTFLGVIILIVLVCIPLYLILSDK